MSRLGSGGRSFLDDLLADDLDKPSSGRPSAKHKSVRFMDNEDSDTDFMASLSMPVKDKQRNDPIEWPKTNASATSIRQTSAVKSSSKSDWLGLGNEEDLVDRQARGRTAGDESASKVSNDQKDDWLNAGLSARKNRTNESKTAFDSSEKSGDNSWLGIRRRAEESKVKISEEKDEKSISPPKVDRNENKISVSSNKSEPDISPEKQLTEISNGNEGMQTQALNATSLTSLTSDPNAISLSTSSAMLLKTQVSVHFVSEH